MESNSGPSVQYAGCIYDSPPQKYGPQGAEDLSSYALENMKCVGLPVYDSHDPTRQIGSITDEWQSSNGSKHVAFAIDNTPENFPQIEGLSNGFFSELSLSHKLGSPHPIPLEVSICHRGQRKGTLINRGETVSEYKRRTLASSNSESAKAPIMSDNSSAPKPMDSDAPNNVQSNSAVPENAPAAPNETPNKPSDQVESVQSGNDVMSAMESALASVAEPYRKILIDHSLTTMRELESANAKLDKAVSEKKQYEKDLQNEREENKKLVGMTRDNIANTMKSIKNFFLQGADNNISGSPDYDQIESMFKNHPTHHHLLSPVISCMAQRNSVLESNLKSTQANMEQSAEERELYQRLRGVARDQSNPTYNYHGFDSSRGQAPVSQNANKRKANEGQPQRKRTQLHDPCTQNKLSELANMMQKTLPTRPQNIRQNE